MPAMPKVMSETPKTDGLQAQQLNGKERALIDYAYLLNEMTLHARTLERECASLTARLGDADKTLETIRVAMGTTSVWEGLNVIDGLRARLEEAEKLMREAQSCLLAACSNPHNILAAPTWQDVANRIAAALAPDTGKK
jgi:hypothetical protein